VYAFMIIASLIVVSIIFAAWLATSVAFAATERANSWPVFQRLPRSTWDGIIEGAVEASVHDPASLSMYALIAATTARVRSESGDDNADAELSRMPPESKFNLTSFIHPLVYGPFGIDYCIVKRFRR
jgi:hypothetical protein